ncbi:MFS general substrate transporter [Cucurbitaria berberidis CBS 394.84]|uniref:MFS general substrate transporter n=1 Tax=Cucurbitaria berberidis CBS 394.84 TaxID=1168544 RepID=A0A9P4GJR8_9PLEO|nr:MFS general substrate transporter [Cucurbitaria berberidis CBS 394.84]KAF1846552.1 MFS general substrate transporter [Cucurbitaria berberidis CBS 394.84]
MLSTLTHDEEEKATNLNHHPSNGPQLLADAFGEEGLTIYEKKCVLVNREIDAMGMGRYQWSLWVLCGFGYMIDLMWAQAFGMILPPLQQELGNSMDQTGNLSTTFTAGLTAGALVWGLLVDVIGRQWVFNLTVFIASAFGLCIGAPSTYTAILVLIAFTGFGVGGNIPIDTTIALEFTPQSKRYLLPLLSIFQPIGVVICSVIAYVFIPNYSCNPNFSEANPLPACNAVASGKPCCTKASNMGWRYLLFTLGGITLLIFFLRFIVFQFQETPEFLLCRGKDAKAIEVLQYVAKYNKRTCALTLEMLESLERDSNSTSSNRPVLGGGAKQLKTTWTEKLKLEGDRFKMLFSSLQMTRLTLLIWVTYICDYWGFTIAGTYLPLILALKNGVLHLSLRFTYRSYIYIYTPGIVGVLLGTLSYRAPRIGRKWTMVVSAALRGVAVFLFSSIDSAASNIGFNVMENFCQSIFNSVLYGWTPEAFPAPIRGTACGLANFWGRLFSIVSPVLAERLYTSGRGEDDINGVLYLAGGVTLGCVITTVLLPSKPVGRQVS